MGKKLRRNHRHESIIVTFDGGYAFTGYRNSDNNRDITVWLVKIAPDSGTRETDPLYTIWIVVAVGIVVAGLGLGLLVYLWKRIR